MSSNEMRNDYGTTCSKWNNGNTQLTTKQMKVALAGDFTREAWWERWQKIVIQEKGKGMTQVELAGER